MTPSEKAIEQLGEFYLIVDVANRGQVYIRETDTDTKEDIVSDIGDGQYTYQDRAGPVGVLSVDMPSGTVVDVSGQFAYDVANYISAKAESKDDPIWNCPFLDAAWPDWRDHIYREWVQEESYEDDYRREGRYIR